MKNLFFVAIAIVMGSATIYAQKSAPLAIKNAFAQKFPTAKNVKWAKETDNEYEAEFSIDGVKYSANFSIDGTWLETESVFDYSHLPANVKASYQAAHKDAKIKDVEKIEKSNGDTFYEVEIRGPITSQEYVYDAEGKLLK